MRLFGGGAAVDWDGAGLTDGNWGLLLQCVVVIGCVVGV